MRSVYLILLSIVVTSCGILSPHPRAGLFSSGTQYSSDESVSLAEARNGFQSKLLSREIYYDDPVSVPPSDLFQLINFDSPVGELAAYVSQPPHDGQKHPAIIWVFGGFSNGIDSTAWEWAPPENDQSASAFREAGIIMMYPSLRGGNNNPGANEGFFGEVNDILAAADYLASQDFVDPDRIYLGGHSTGETLVLLVAASTDRFRAVFSFGPVEDVGYYGPENLPFDTSDLKELELRAPIRWLHSIQSPVFVFEGTESPGNLGSLKALADVSNNPSIDFHSVPGGDHFSILAPMTRLTADKIIDDDGISANIEFSEVELGRLFSEYRSDWFVYRAR